jgi:hypothetical protein
MVEDDSDWCGKHKTKSGKKVFIDLTLSFDRTWSYFYDGKRIESDIHGKKNAMTKLLAYIKDR